MHIGWPQGIFIALTVIGAANDIRVAAQQTAPNAGELCIASMLLGNIVIYSLLIWGGFFG